MNTRTFRLISVALLLSGLILAACQPAAPVEEEEAAPAEEEQILITAVALVRPSKSIYDVKLRSVRRKWKDKAFAAAVDRQEIEKAADDLGVELWEHVGVVLAAMQGIAGALGLEGKPA